MSDLKPCPFCGDAPRQTVNLVECPNPDCLMYFEEQYVFEWNKRVCPEWVKRAMERIAQDDDPFPHMADWEAALRILREEAEKDGVEID